MSVEVRRSMSAVASVPIHDPPSRVLLVDDDPMWRMLTARALRERGYHVSDFDCAQDALAAIRALGPEDCVMSANLSCQQLRTGLLPRVAAKAHGVPASRLAVELTESGMMQDPEVALAYLTRLPLTTLKIDRSFVQDLPASERSLAVARAIVALGSNLQLRLVAEGVETAPQRQALSALGCDLQQGYLYGRAVPLDEALRIAALPDGAVCPVLQETNP